MKSKITHYFASNLVSKDKKINTFYVDNYRFFVQNLFMI